MVLNAFTVQLINGIQGISKTHHTLSTATFFLPPPVLHFGELTRLLQFEHCCAQLVSVYRVCNKEKHLHVADICKRHYLPIYSNAEKCEKYTYSASCSNDEDSVKILKILENVK